MPPPEEVSYGQAGPWPQSRRVLLRFIVAFFLAAPFFSHPKPDPAQIVFLLPATVALIVVVSRIVIRTGPPLRGEAALTWMIIIAGLGISILVVGGLNWVGAIFIAGAGVGRLSESGRVAVLGAACCAASGLGVGLSHGIIYGGSLELTLGPLLAAFFAYSAARRSELVDKLHQTRAELARMAVADERLRIARDLHDLLGHSLSLITLKAELAGRVVGSDPDRAAREIADLETVARRSLGEVRAAVTSYRQPSLPAELAAARQMLTAAGMETQVTAPDSVELPADAEALLAWTVREGVTNVVRHSGARNVSITISVAPGEAAAEVADDGVGPPWESGRRPGTPGPGASGSGGPGSGGLGSGLAGLAERARAAGAEISTGEGRAGKGFRLRVQVPVARFSGS